MCSILRALTLGLNISKHLDQRPSITDFCLTFQNNYSRVVQYRKQWHIWEGQLLHVVRGNREWLIVIDCSCAKTTPSIGHSCFSAGVVPKGDNTEGLKELERLTTWRMSWGRRWWCGGQGWAAWQEEAEHRARLEGARLKSRARRAPQPSRWPKLGESSSFFHSLTGWSGVRMGRQEGARCTCQCPPATPSGRSLQTGEARCNHKHWPLNAQI